MSVKPLLFFGYGNPSRGDDAVGPIIIERLLEEPRFKRYIDRFDALTDYQLQIEHSVDMHQRKQVIFIDAIIGQTEPFLFTRINANEDRSYTTHALSPQALMSVYQQVYHLPPAPTYLLSIQSTQFELGTTISDISASAIEQAMLYIESSLLRDNLFIK